MVRNEERGRHSRYEALVDLRSEVLKAVQSACETGIVERREQATLVLQTTLADHQVLNAIPKTAILELLQVADFDEVCTPEFETTRISVKRTANRRCDRCRRYCEDAEFNSFFCEPNEAVCSRCVTTLAADGAC